MILDLWFTFIVGGILRDFGGWNGATAIYEACKLSMLLVPVRRALVWPVFSRPRREADGGLRYKSHWWLRTSTTWVLRNRCRAVPAGLEYFG